MLEISDLRFEGSRPFVDIEINFVGEAARYTALAEFALRIDVAVKFVWITRKVGLSPTTWGSFCSPLGPGPGTIDCSLPISPSWKASGA